MSLSSIKGIRLIFLSIAFFVIAIAGYVFVKPAFYKLSEFLSKSEQVTANILLVEGWLSYQSLETAVQEFRKNDYDYILTTGLKSTPEYYGKQRIKNNLTSNADIARRRLTLMGIDSARIISVPGEKVIINRTLTSAIAVRDWLKTTEIKAEGINILSSGTHSRRTWMTFSKILGDSCQIGIISIPDYKNNHSTKRRLSKTIRETAAIVYYWLILIPY